MNRRGKPRKFPYYIITDIDTKALRMRILDLNTIQKEEYVIEDGKEKKVIVYIPDKDKHDLKWIDIPGKTQKDQQAIVKWINDMVFPDGKAHPNKYMVYDARRHFTDPIHEENKVNSFRQWENENFQPIEDDEDISLDTEIEEDE
jgi:hypothetical protein